MEQLKQGTNLFGKQFLCFRLLTIGYESSDGRNLMGKGLQRKYPNVDFQALDVQQVLQGTPFESFYNLHQETTKLESSA